MALGYFGISSRDSSSSLTIGAAADRVCDVVSGLIGMQSLTVGLRFSYGSGGESVRAFLQTSLDEGETWIDIACVLFQLASEHRVLNFSALTPKGQTTPTDAAMADDTVLDGILGDRVRLRVVSTGTYGGSTLLTGRVVAH